MTWEEMLVRPYGSDPFVYQGEAEKEWERDQWRKEGLRPYLIVKGRSYHEGPIYELAGEGRVGTGLGGYEPDDPFAGYLTGPSAGKKTETCFKPAPGKKMWIKPPDACVFPTSESDPGYKWKIGLLKKLKECYGFTDIAIGADYMGMKAAADAGLSPTDITLSISPCKLSDNCEDFYHKFCSTGVFTFQAYVNMLAACLRSRVNQLNSYFGNYGQAIKPFRRIWIDEPGTGSDFGCDFKCPNSDYFATNESFIAAIYEAIKQLRENYYEEGFFGYTPDGDLVQTQFIVSQYNTRFDVIGIKFGTDNLSTYAGKADNIYSDQYKDRIYDEWNHPAVTNGSMVSLQYNYQYFEDLLKYANYTMGWDTMGLFSSLDRNGNKYTDCDAWQRELREYCEAALRAGWLQYK